VFNEPLFTDYSLPRKLGYDGATYATHVKAFARAARQANPDSRVPAGIGYLSEGQILEDFDKFFAAGGLTAAEFRAAIKDCVAWRGRCTSRLRSSFQRKLKASRDNAGHGNVFVQLCPTKRVAFQLQLDFS
jgi:hypothetical protein